MTTPSLASQVSAAMAEADSKAPAAAKPQPKAEATPEPKTETEIQKEIRKFKLKIDGKDEELPEDEVLRLATHGRAAAKRMEEAANERKQIEQFLTMMQNDPKAVLRNPKLAHLRSAMEELLYEDIQEQQLTPEQKKQRDIERELKKYKDSEAETKRLADEQAAKDLQNHYADDYERRITSALDQGGVPKTKGTVRRMAYYLTQALANKIDLEPADLVAQVRRDYQEEHRELYAAVDEDKLPDFLGEELLKKARQSDIKRQKTTQPDMFKSTGKRREAAAPDKTKKKSTGGDWRKDMIKDYLGK